jgi:hypothetical protein
MLATGPASRRQSRSEGGILVGVVAKHVLISDTRLSDVAMKLMMMMR